MKNTTSFLKIGLSSLLNKLSNSGNILSIALMVGGLSVLATPSYADDYIADYMNAIATGVSNGSVMGNIGSAIHQSNDTQDGSSSDNTTKDSKQEKIAKEIIMGVFGLSAFMGLGIMGCCLKYQLTEKKRAKIYNL